MPRGDGTGPVGAGPMTGAGRGYDARNRRTGRYGCARMYYETGLPGWKRSGNPFCHTDEKDLLAREADILESRLKQVREKMEILNTPPQETKSEVQSPEVEGR